MKKTETDRRTDGLTDGHELRPTSMGKKVIIDPKSGLNEASERETKWNLLDIKESCAERNTQGDRIRQKVGPKTRDWQCPKGI